MSQVFDNGELRPVYYKVKTVNGKPQFRRAPFDVLVIDGKWCLKPVSLGFSDQAINRLGVDSLEDRDLWRGDLAYETLSPVIVDENVMGDGSDSWMGKFAMNNK